MLSGSPLSFSKSSGEWLWKRWPAALLSLGRAPRLRACRPCAVRTRQDLGLGRRQHAVEPAQHGHGQHDPLVLRRPVRPAQQVGDLPDQVRKVVVVRHGSAFLVEPDVVLARSGCPFQIRSFGKCLARPFSQRLLVSNVTPSRAAIFPCVSPRLFRNSRTRPAVLAWLLTKCLLTSIVGESVS